MRGLGFHSLFWISVCVWVGSGVVTGELGCPRPGVYSYIRRRSCKDDARGSKCRCLRRAFGESKRCLLRQHYFLFEDGGRGQGATLNLPKLRTFIQLMKGEGFVFKTLDQYSSSRVVKSAAYRTEEAEQASEQSTGGRM